MNDLVTGERESVSESEREREWKRENERKRNKTRDKKLEQNVHVLAYEKWESKGQMSKNSDY